VRRIGIIGTGTQARLQLRFLAEVTACREVLAWGRSAPSLERYCTDEALRAFRIATTHDAGEVLRTCNLIVTTTPATSPLLFAKDLQPGTHITAVGSDTTAKQELEATILAQADVVVADSKAQCQLRGEIHHALVSGVLTDDAVVELGDVIAERARGRTGGHQVTVADLTGVAVQDMAIASLVYDALRATAQVQ
jgi:ornithine cyclodeaminase